MSDSIGLDTRSNQSILQVQRAGLPCLKDEEMVNRNEFVAAWVEEMAALCQPDRIVWCDGSETERQALTAEAVARGILIELDQKKWPGCYYHRSHPNDVARAEQCTYICTEAQDEAGPTNNWKAPVEMYQRLYGLARGSMKGRTMYVVPYLMGPPDRKS